MHDRTAGLAPLRTDRLGSIIRSDSGDDPIEQEDSLFDFESSKRGFEIFERIGARNGRGRSVVGDQERFSGCGDRGEAGKIHDDDCLPVHVRGKPIQQRLVDVRTQRLPVLKQRTFAAGNPLSAMYL